MSPQRSDLLGSLPPISVAGRVARVRAALPAEVEAMVVSDRTNIRWLTGFTGSNAILVITPDACTLLTDSRYATQAPDQVAEAGVAVAIGADPVVLGAPSLAAHRRVALEADHLTWAAHRRWSDRFSLCALSHASAKYVTVAGVVVVADVVAVVVVVAVLVVVAELVAVEGMIVGLRSVKDAAELARIEAAAALTDESLADASSLLVAGTTERHVSLALDDGIRRRGGSGPAYETIVASGPNAALPHARPTDRTFEPGDLVVVDVGALVEGYRSDMTRTFVIGDPDDRASELIDLVTQAQAAGVAVAGPGVATGTVDAACRDFLTEAGHGDAFTHGTGHGVGLDIHELPSIRRANAAILQPGQVITVEPGVYYPGYGGVRVEDSVVITETGCRPITPSPKLAF